MTLAEAKIEVANLRDAIAELQSERGSWATKYTQRLELRLKGVLELIKESNG
jgi:hypothetical protein